MHARPIAEDLLLNVACVNRFMWQQCLWNWARGKAVDAVSCAGYVAASMHAMLRKGSGVFIFSEMFTLKCAI